MINIHDNVLFLGFSYKPNCQDIRNTKVAFIVKELSEKGYSIDCYDPLVNADDVYNEYGIKLITSFPMNFIMLSLLLWLTMTALSLLFVITEKKILK